MTKGEKLIWELFLMVREVMPVTAENTARHNEWARVFHEMERPDTPPPPPQGQEPATEHVDEDADDELVDPHEHGVPTRSVGKRKKR